MQLNSMWQGQLTLGPAILCLCYTVEPEKKKVIKYTKLSDLAAHTINI